MDKKILSRRSFLKAVGLGGATVAAGSIVSCATGEKQENPTEPPVGQMTYRTNPKNNEKVSILGYGMMLLPPVDSQGSAREDGDAEIDQEMVNRQVDYAIEHGVNYFDTSPAYCKGRSEHCTGIALARHKRDEFIIATKLSNFAPETWTHEAGVQMFQNSLKELQVDYIDYLLLHAVGGGDDPEDAMKKFNARYIDNGVLDYLLEQREKGVIKNLGFSYHGHIEVYDYLLSQHDKYKWDFVQIQLNYFDWKNADKNDEDNAEYLYNELVKRNIPAIIMEPLLGGRLAKLPDPLATKLLQREPERSVASWAFRYAGTHPGVLTVLSGMTRMSDIEENCVTFSPLKPCSPAEFAALERAAEAYLACSAIPCNSCNYCMPCPYGLDIPSILTFRNLYLTKDGKRKPREILKAYAKMIPEELRRADHCTGCGRCNPHCPQQIDIPKEIAAIDAVMDVLKTEALR